MTPDTITISFVFIYGLLIGSFLNVCIYRIPRHESIVVTRSHCMACGERIKWYDLIPVVSYLILGGKCRNCKERISIQYPLIEGFNAVGYVWIFINHGVNIDSILYSFMFSALLVISIIDARTFEIPIGLNMFLAALGVIHLGLFYEEWSTYVIGAVCVSGLLLLIYLVSRGRGIGGGDIKLMAATGLMLGWQKIILAFFMGCILASVLHIIQMIVGKKGRTLAFGPYLSVGVMISAIYGRRIIDWYLSTLR